MLLDIRHRTEYHYEAPVRESVMELWMQPQKVHQRLISFSVDVTPAAQVFDYIDTYGNAVHHFDVPQPHDNLRIVTHATVETTAPPPLPEALDLGEWDRLRSDFVRGECFDYLQPHRFVQTTEALQAFIKKEKLEDLKRLDPLTAVKQLNQKLYAAFEYTPGFTEADSPIDIALKSHRGVCQDFAHIMLAICRHWGIPARYVSGYLFTDRKAGDRSDPDATHAWVEIFLPQLRWVGFDPTNNMLTGERHVAVAVGRDYGDVAPTRGVYKGEAESHLSVAVMVRKAKGALASEPEFMRVARPAFSGARRRQPGDAFREQQQQQQQ